MDGIIVNIDTVLPPVEKADQPRVVGELKTENQYRYPAKYLFIPYQELTNQVGSGKLK